MRPTNSVADDERLRTKESDKLQTIIRPWSFVLFRLNASSLERGPAVEQRSSHDKLVYFRGAAADTGVAQHVIPVGYGHIQGLPHAAKDLHDFINTAPAPLTGAEFDH